MSTRARGCRGCGAAGPGGRTLFVRWPEDLRRLTHSYGRFDAVFLESDSIDERGRRGWEERLLAAYAACGCDTGAVAVMLAVFSLPFLAALAPGVRGPLAALLVFLLILGGALVGKLLGIAYARLRLHLEVRALGELLRSHQAAGFDATKTLRFRSRSTARRVA